MAGPITGKVRSGRFRPPKLDNGALTRIGTEIVDTQKQRWAQGVNAGGGKAAPLTRPYLFRKAKIRRTNRPIRDLHLTGLLLSNFTLRKALDGVIRAEPTSRKGREHATSANQKDQMIGFSGTDLKKAYDEAQKEYGALAKKLWYEVR